MRTFIAIETNQEVQEELKRIQNKISYGVFKKTNDFHITLKFLGEKNDFEIERIKEKLSEIKFKSFQITIEKIGFFPNENFIRVVWVGTKEREVFELQKLIDQKLLELKIPAEKEFQSHITIARVKQINDKKKFLESIKSINIKNISFKVTEFKLKKSVLTPKGPIYSDLGVFKLQD
ncbi:MAG: RNA 2',3'-cyclic phosphodiesterase [Candidatus Woesearchaeota archaeon]